MGRPDLGPSQPRPSPPRRPVTSGPAPVSQLWADKHFLCFTQQLHVF